MNSENNDFFAGKTVKANCNGYTGVYNSSPEIKAVWINKESNTIQIQVKDRQNHVFWLDIKVDITQNANM